MSNYRFNSQTRGIPEDVEESRTIEFVISTSKKDRHGTRVLLDRWGLENFNNNGIVGYQHDVYGGGMCTDEENPDKVLGIGKAWADENHIVSEATGKGALIGSVKFEPGDINPLAEKIFRKVLHGTLKSTSVGFTETEEGDFGKGDEAKGKPDQTYYYGAQELLEFSIVNLPSNTDARVRALRDQTANALNYIRKSIGGEIKTSDMLKMSVAEVLDMLESPESRTALIGGEIIDNERGSDDLGDVLADQIAMDTELMDLDIIGK